MPVSYTHLDVYKRQPIIFETLCVSMYSDMSTRIMASSLPKALAEAVFGQEAGLEYKSKVHKRRRDVYKRQVWRALNTDEVAEPNAFAITAAVAAFRCV